jgi:formiminotetrahydrofolate cyclodeaminase
MTSTTPITSIPLYDFTSHISGQNHAMAGATIAASAAQAVSLGRACMAISLSESGAKDNSGQIDQMDRIVSSLLDWCDRDATAIAAFVNLRESGQEVEGQMLLCHAPAEISRLSLEAANALQVFRARVSEKVQDDLEMALTLLAGTARAAMLLLDSNLRIWPEPDLLEKYEPVRAGLEQEIKKLSPADRIRG